METYFTRTMRSIQGDYLQLMVVGTLMMTALLTAWVFWFFLAQITFYAASVDAQIQLDGAVAVRFSTDDLLQIRLGQPAWLQFDNGSGRPQLVAATVSGIDPATGKVLVIPKLDVKTFVHLRTLTISQVKIAVNQVSPATLVFRAAGLKPES